MLIIKHERETAYRGIEEGTGGMLRITSGVIGNLAEIRELDRRNHLQVYFLRLLPVRSNRKHQSNQIDKDDSRQHIFRNQISTEKRNRKVDTGNNCALVDIFEVVEVIAGDGIDLRSSDNANQHCKVSEVRSMPHESVTNWLNMGFALPPVRCSVDESQAR